ncbi:MAG: hypothetical protein J5982_03715 [Bacilli bacterium]|nr:hypothetical protein [Bacilli bacterium]
MYFNYIKKHIFTTKNIILFIIFLLISIAMMFTISIGVIFSNLKDTLYNNNSRFRTLIVNGDIKKYDQIEKIEHVTVVEDTVYLNPLSFKAKEFNTDLQGEVSLNPILDKKNLIITKGKMAKGKNEAICSDVFFPYEIEENNGKTIFNKNRLIYAKDIINKSFSIVSEENETFTFKIVGAYNSEINNNYLNSCYISKEVFKKIAPEYNGGSTRYNEETGEMVFVPTKRTGKIVLVDDYENVQKVQKEISKIGLSSQPASELNKEYVDLLTYVPIFASIIITLVFIIILESYLSKKIKYNCKSYAILKSIGYNQKNIKTIDFIENILLLIISWIFTIIIYIIVFNYIKYVYYAEYIYDGTILHFSIIPIILTIILMLTFLIIVNKKVLKHKLEENISRILL